jgi:hypothetical protein
VLKAVDSDNAFEMMHPDKRFDEDQRFEFVILEIKKDDSLILSVYKYIYGIWVQPYGVTS